LPLVQVAVLDAGQSAYKDKLVELVRRIGSSHPTAGGATWPADGAGSGPPPSGWPGGYH